MKQFFTFVFASMLGFALIILFVVILGVGAALTTTRPRDTAVAANSILKLNLDELTGDRGTSSFDFEKYRIKEKFGLLDLIKAIKNAKADANIKGVYLNISSVSGGYATTEEIRNALLDFKRSGKFIYAYSETMTEKAYYLLSAASKIYLNPQGIIEFNGLNSEFTFFKGALDKLGIEAQVFRVGKYKSFVEPFTLSRMSEANRTQTKSYLNSLYEFYMKNIAAVRSVDLKSLLSMSDDLKVQNPTDALRLHLVDYLGYKDDVIEALKKGSGATSTKSLSLVSVSDYIRSGEKESTSGSRIAVVYASGDIGPGEGDDNTIGSERISRTIRSLREDKRVKALVLRVNSPGGSALASEVIWREIDLTRKTKPVVVSMGDVAASGGYYIACAASKIFAEPNTITGSIGIFSIIPNTQRFFGDKLGITFDRVSTGKYSDIVTVTRPLSSTEKQIIQKQVTNGYDTFVKRVADGRKKKVAIIDSLAQGRVYTGAQALDCGLIDRLGSFNDALKEAAGLAKLKTYYTVAYPTQRTIIENFLMDAQDRLRSSTNIELLVPQLQALARLKKLSGVQARLPFDISFD